jgi:type II secretory pathway component PulC
LRDGDLISSVNGLATNGPDNALAIYASLRSVGRLSVELERAGRRITAEYDIE